MCVYWCEYLWGRVSRGKQHILWLQITVNDVLEVEVSESCKNLLTHNHTCTNIPTTSPLASGAGTTAVTFDYMSQNEARRRHVKEDRTASKHHLS